MPIVIPTLLGEKLDSSGNERIKGALFATLDEFNEWLKISKLTFFPDYTDHGESHLSNVLATAANLITTDAEKHLTAEDSAVLILAVLLHDAAMHISKEGFRELIKGRGAAQIIQDFDTVTWPTLWDDFLFSAKHWDEAKRGEVFGIDNDTKRPLIDNVRDPFDHLVDLQETDERLIGEFIRRHHPRLAHEFALFGVPGHKGNFIKPNPGLKEDECNIAGLIARSHGLPMRKCSDYMKEKYGQQHRAYGGIHSVYLMVLLRIADCLQIQGDRTSRLVFYYKHISSQKSELEHKVHSAIKSISSEIDDPEAISVISEPPDVRTFLRTKEWLESTQRELDNSWAILGETYGRYGSLRDLGIRIRRVTSNLDDEQEFRKTVCYIPRRIELDVARPELLKLMIHPLYGRKPQVGIRELVQNAVDAVRERSAFQERHNAYENVPLLEMESDVKVWLDDLDESGYAWLTVSDKGIGMKEDVIKDYFLTAGACYRLSDAWRREYENPNLGSNIKSQVLRSGRFGVGILAAFLLGDEIEVYTRHITASKGLVFKTRLDSGPIELRIEEKQGVGTAIKVKVTGEVYKVLKENPPSWDWYCLRQPTVARFVGRNGLKQSCIFASQKDEVQPPWHRIQHSDYDNIQWTYEHPSSPILLVCNGLKIISFEDFTRRTGPLASTAFWSLGVPCVSVFDSDGNLPLSLNRYYLTDTPKYHPMLVESAIKDILARILASIPDDEINMSDALMFPTPSALTLSLGSHPNFGGQSFLITPHGLTVFDAGIISQLPLTSVLFRALNWEKFFDPPTTGDHSALYLGKLDDLYHVRTMGDYLLNVVRDAPDSPECPLRGVRLLFGKSFYESLGMDRHYGRRISTDWAGERWLTVSKGQCDATQFDQEALEASSNNFIPPFAAELFLHKPIPTGDLSPLARGWLEIIKNPVIPFSVEERKVKLAHAYEVLEPYISFYRKMQKEKQK